jgi:O-antigen/teichoic acid export membrane protein
VLNQLAAGLAERVRRYRRDVANMLSVEIVTLASMAVIFPLTIRNLGDQGYGEYTALYLVSGLSALWVSSAPSAAMVQLILQKNNDSTSLLRLARRQALTWAGPVAIGGTAVAVAMFGTRVLVPALVVLSAEFIFTTLASLNMAVVFAVSGVRVTTRVRLVQPVLRALGVLLLAVAGVLNIGTLVVLNATVSGIVFCLSTWARRRARPKVETTAATARSLFRFSTYYAASMLTNEMQNEGENLVMASSRPAAELGQYAAAYRVVLITLIPLNAVAGAANRWFLVQDDRDGVQLRRTVRLAIPTTLYGIVAGVGILLGRNVIQWVAGPTFDEVATIAAWLCLLPLLHGLSGLPPMGLLGLSRNRERMIMGFATAAMSLVAYLLLVPSMGWRGGVIGTYISEVISIVAGFWCLRHYQRIVDRAADDVDPSSLVRGPGATQPSTVARPPAG